MNSNFGKSNSSSGSLNSFNFDLGLNSGGRSKSLSDQKHNTSSSSSSSPYTYTSTQPKPSNGSPWSTQPNKPSWTHQPAAAAPVQPGLGGPLSGPTSMAGDIFGKSWSSTGPSTSTPAAIGLVGMAKKDPNLFGDLVTSALGTNKSSGGGGNVPLKNANAAPTGNKNTFSMGGVADSLPKTGNIGKSDGGWGSSDSFGSFTSASNVNLNTKSTNLGGPSMKGMSGIGMNTKKDPFGNLADFNAKPMNAGGKTGNKKNSPVSDSFGEFQTSTKNTVPASNTSSNVDNFDVLFSSTTNSSMGDSKGNTGFVNQEFTGGDDWGIGSDFGGGVGGGGGDGGGTTELEGLPPPPAGVSASSAKNKGMENYKSGQYPDAIKWLSWAVILFEKSGDDSARFDVLSSRASCYKEVGEYKKAVADCSKVLEHDSKNVSVLVQRALLYESMEKYKLGAEDLRTVMKFDPGNRVARSTIHRLTKMAG